MIVVDLDDYYMRVSALCWQRQYDPVHLTTKMILGDLIKVGVDGHTLFAAESCKSWRNSILSQFKRRELHSALEFYTIFLKEALGFHILYSEGIDTYDYATVAVEYYNEYPVVIVSSDPMYEQLADRGNCQLYSPKTKKYKKVKDPYKGMIKHIDKIVTEDLATAEQTIIEYNKVSDVYNFKKIPVDVRNQALAVLQKEFEAESVYDPGKIRYSDCLKQWAKIEKEREQYENFRAE